MADRSLTVRLRAEVDQYRRDMALASTATAGVGQAAAEAGKQRTAMQGLGDVGKTVGKTLLGIGTTAAAGMAALTVATFKTGIEYNTLEQTSRAALTTLLGSATAANKQMDLLREFGRSSPFPRQVWIQAQQQLLAFGMAAEQIIPTLSAIQDGVAAAGGGATDIQEIVRVLAQVQSTGKVTAETLNQLGVRGIDAATLVGNAFGKTASQIRDEISSGALDAATFLTVLTEQMTARFGGAAEGVKNTWLGATDRIKGALRDIGSAMAEPFVDPMGGGAAVVWANDVADALRKLEAQIRSLLPALRNQAGPAFENVSDLLRQVAEAIGEFDLQGFISQVSGAVPALAGLGGGLAAAGGASVLTAVGFGGLATSINPLVAGIAALVIASPELRDLLLELLQALLPLLPMILDTGIALATALTTGVAVAAEVLIALVPLVAALVETFGLLPGPVQSATLALGAFALALRFGGPIGGAMVALAALGAIIETFGTKSVGATVATSDLSEELARLEKSGRVTGELMRLFGEDAEFFGEKLDLAGELANNQVAQIANLSVKLGTELGLVNNKLEDAADRFKALDEGMAQAVRGGEDADAMLQALVDTYQLNEDQVEDLLALLPEYNKAAERQAELAEDGVVAQEGLAGSVEATTLALREQADELRAQHDPAFNLLKRLGELEDAQAAYNQAVKDNGPKSRAARDASVALAEAAIELQGAVGDASGTFRNKLDPAMRATLVAAGLTEDQIDGVENALGDARRAAEKYEGEYAAKMKLLGAREVEATARRVQRELANIDRFINISLNVTEQRSVGSVSTPRQHGGPIFGPAGIDRVPAMLTAGEHVWTVREVQAAGGHEGVEALRAAVLGQSSRFAVSTPVGMPRIQGGGSPTADGAMAGGEFTGELYLDSGVFLGQVRGQIERSNAAVRRSILAGKGAAR